MNKIAKAIAGIGVLFVAAYMWNAGCHVGGGWIFALGVLTILDV